MAEWNGNFQGMMDMLNMSSLNSQSEGLLHAFIKSWEHENECLVWLTKVPGDNIFGANVLFVNDKVINKLQWTIEEWVSGTASQTVLSEAEQDRFRIHLAAKSTLPTLLHILKKNGSAAGDYVFYVQHDLPYNLRLTVALPG